MLHDFHANCLEVEQAGVAQGASRWAIIATYCYVRRFFADAWMVRVEKWEGAWLLYWRICREDEDEQATIISALWSKQVDKQPPPFPADQSDNWIDNLELEAAKQRERDAKHKASTKGRKSKKRDDDELLTAIRAPVITFKREQKPEVSSNESESKSEYDAMLENLF